VTAPRTQAVDRHSAQHWYARWEKQQELYAGDREERFEAALDAVESVCGAPRVIVDLGSGPGSFAARAAQRFPAATVVAVDLDPFLIALGAAAHPSLEFVLSNIGTQGWASSLHQYSGRIDAIITSTALHYPPREVLDVIYRDCRRILQAGGVLVDADQFLPDGREWEGLLSRFDEIRARRTARPHEDWTQWWRAVEVEPAFVDLLTLRASVVPAHERDNDLSVDDHLRSMRSAGFSRAGTVWQHGHSCVIVAVTAVEGSHSDRSASRNDDPHEDRADHQEHSSQQ
jgi:SAM-dependent methyltransferase